MRTIIRAALFTTVAISTAAAQRPIPIPVPPIWSPRPRPSSGVERNDDRSGPRFGAAYLVGGSVTAERNGEHVQPLMSLFGWQVEQSLTTGVKDAPVPLVEFIGLVGGLEQNTALLSGTMLIAARQRDGWEAGLGPTLTGAGTQLTFAAGITHHVGLLNFPINLAVTPGRRGASISLTTGFNRRS